MSDDGREASLDSMLRAVRRGDRDGFERLMAVHRREIEEIVARGIDGRLRSVMDPEDVVQDVLLAAYRGVGEADFPSEASFRAWLVALSHNRLADLARRHFKTQRRGSGSVSLDKTLHGTSSAGMRLGEALPSYDPSPSTIASRRETAEALEALLVRIPAHYREIIRLLQVDRLPTKEIATRLGKRPEAVRRTLTRALEACRVALRRSALGSAKERATP